MNDRLRKLQTYPMVELEKRKQQILAAGKRLFDFGTGDPREPTPAFIRQAFVDGVPEVSQYPTVAGWPEMRRAAGAYLKRRFGVEVDADAELMPTQGSKEAIFHLPMSMVQIPSDKDVVVYGEPAYPVFEIGALFAEAWTWAMPLNADNGYLMDPETLPEAVLRRAAVVFLNYPHNPTGVCLPDSLFEAWVKARDEYDFLLVSDECYADLYYEDPAPRSVLEFAREGCLAVHSLSKRSGMTGYRSGFVAGDADVVAQYRRFRSGMGVAPPDPVQAASAAAWADSDHVEQRRALFGEKRRVLLDLFAELGLKVFPGRATLFLWVQVPTGNTDVGYAEQLLDVGIVVSPGSFFGKGQERFFRVALVPSLAECEAAAKAWPR